MRIKNNHWLMMLVTSGLYILPMVISGKFIAYYGQDAGFHLSRLIGVTNVFESPVNFLSFNHTGVMVNEFYPWLTLLPMSWLYQLTDNIVLAYWMYFYVLTVATMVIAYKSFQIVDSKNSMTNAPIIFAIIYAMSTYRTADILTRSAVGEAITLTFLPLIFAGIYHVILGNYKKWTLVSMGMALVAYSHMVTLLLVSIIFVILIIPTFWRWNDKWLRLAALVKATFVTVLLSAFVFIPFIEQSMYQEIYTPEPQSLVGQNVVSYLAKTGVNWLQGQTLGPILALGLIFAFWNRNKFLPSQRVLLYLTTLMIVMMTSVFPWSIISQTKIGEFLAQVQFLWRFNGIISMFLAYLLTLTLCETSILPMRKYNWRYGAAFAALLMVQITGMSLLGMTVQSKTMNHRETVKFVQSISQYKDYRPASSISSQEKIDEHKIMLDGKVINAKWHVTNNDFKMSLNNGEKGTSKLTLPVFHYLGQRVTVNGRSASYNRSNFGTTTVVIPSGKVTVRIWTEYTLVAKVSAVFSLLTLAGFAIWMYRTRERKLKTQFTENFVLS